MSRSRRGKRKTLRKRAEDLLLDLMPMVREMADLKLREAHSNLENEIAIAVLSDYKEEDPP